MAFLKRLLTKIKKAEGSKMRRITTILLFYATTAAIAAPQVVSQTPGGVEIKLSDSREINLLQSHSRINLKEVYPDAEMIGLPGGPALPRYRLLVGLPPEGEVNFNYSIGSRRELDGVELETYTMPGIGPAVKDNAGWADTLTPIAYYVTRWRDYRIAVVEITPLRYFSKDRRLVILYDIDINISFGANAGMSRFEEDQFDEIYKGAIANYEQVKSEKIKSAAEINNPFSESGNWIKITVPEDGVYKIGFTELRKAGVDPSKIDPSSLKILYPRKSSPEEPFPDTLSELPCFVHGEGDGRFDRSDFIIFFGQGANHWNYNERKFEVNPYVKENVYWLTWGIGKGSRVKTRPAYVSEDAPLTSAKSVLHFEEDKECPARSGFLWLWKSMQKNTSILRDSFTLSLEGITKIDTFTFRAYADSAGGGFRLLVGSDTLDYRPLITNGVISDPDYSVSNPEIEPSDRWNLIVEFFGDGYKGFYPDWIRIVGDRSLSFNENPYWVVTEGDQNYRIDDLNATPYLFDLSDPQDPVLLTDWENKNSQLTFNPRSSSSIPLWIADNKGIKTPSLLMANPGTLWTEDWRVDYIIVSTDENFDAANEYKNYRNDNLEIKGVADPKVKAVNIEDIVQDFGYGLAEPQALRHFLSYAYSSGLARPRYVLLLGDGTYDYKNNWGYGSRPEYLLIHTKDYLLDPNVLTGSGAAEDGWFVEFDDKGFFPEMSVSRITARDNNEARNILDKIKRYESSPKEAWSSRVLLLSDDFYQGSLSKPDDITNHVSACEKLEELLYPEFDPVKVYLSDYSFVGGLKPGAHDALMYALDKGALLWFYFGHGKGDQLTHEKVFLTTDVPAVSNGSKLPLAMFCSCGIGRFEDTRWECVAEELVRNSEGAIASIAATKGTGPTNNEKLADSLVNTFRNLKHANLGDVFFAITPIDKMYILFGDPGTSLVFPETGSFSSTPVDFTTADTAEISFNSNMANGSWFASAYGSWFEKTAEGSSQTYNHKGELLYYSEGALSSGEKILKFLVPTGIREGSLAYWYILCATDDSLKVFRYDSLGVLAGSSTSSDHKGPLASFIVNSKELIDGDTVPSSFTLEIELEDPSGINLTGLPGVGLGGGNPFSIMINDQKTELASYFEYETESGEAASKGRVILPVELSSEQNKLILYAVDNLRNTSKYELNVFSSSISSIEIKDALVYPNPVSSSADFTFEVNVASKVSIQIFSISGRLLRKLPAVSYPSGFNLYPWDGLDAQGRPLPNGVYIYRLSAESEDERFAGLRTAVNEKFIVIR